MTKRKHKYFQGKKYYLNQDRWRRVTHPQIYLSHDVWNYYYPNDKVLREEDIHHINGDTSDDRIENLEKIMHGKHRSLHQIGVDHSGKNNPMYGTHRAGSNNPNWKGGITIDWNKYQRERRWRTKKMKDLIEEILDIFDIDTEDMRSYYSAALKDIFIEQDKITSTEE